MLFRSDHSLRTFDTVASKLSMSAAADDMNQSEDSLNFQISKLEAELGFLLFERTGSTLVLRDAGRRLWQESQAALSQVDREIEHLRGHVTDSVTIGALMYFSTNWLCPRLTRFFDTNPGVSLRLESIHSMEQLATARVDFAIVWGSGDWSAYESERLFACPAVPDAEPKPGVEAPLGAPEVHVESPGYHLVFTDTAPTDSVTAFLEWLRLEARG